MALASLTRPTDYNSSAPRGWKRWSKERLQLLKLQARDIQTHQERERDILDVDARLVCVIKEPEELAP